MAKLKENNSGLTLIGVLVAILVFSVMLIAVTQLMARSEKTIGISREEFVATNLAREGLELAQYIRDSNWLSRGHTTPLNGRTNPPDHPWVAHPFLNTPLCLNATTNTAPYVVTIEYDKDQGAIMRVKAGNATSKWSTVPPLFFNSSEHYVNENAPTSNATPFSRAISVDCSHQAPPDEYITVTSRVWWTSRGQDREVSVSTKLYNWYQ